MRAARLVPTLLLGVGGCASAAPVAGSAGTVGVVATDRAPAAVGPYAQATVANGMLYAAGQLPLDPQSGQIVGSDIAAQTERVLANLSAILAARGATWSNVVKTTVFVQDLRDFPRLNETYARVLGSARPARSTVQVAAIPRGALVEIDLVAALPR